MRLNSANARNVAAPCLRTQFAQPAVTIVAGRCLALAHNTGSVGLQPAVSCIVAEQLSLREEFHQKWCDRQAATRELAVFSFCISLAMIANFPLS